jgi:hypothetical protein
MGRAWYDLLVVAALLLAYVVPRYFLRPERHPWEIWIPAAFAGAVIVGALATENWALAAVAGVVVPIEIWRTLPRWRHLKRALPSHGAR